MAEILVPLLWVPILGFVAWCWSGRSARARSWAGNPFAHGVVLGAAPGVGLMIFSAWLQKVFGVKIMVMAAPLALLGVLVFLVGFFTPRWWGPRWFRRMSDEEKVDTRQALNAAGIAALARRRPGRSAVKAAEAFGGRGELLGRWRGGYVHDPDSRERAHGMARWSTVDGTLMVSTEGFTFAATKAEDELREKATVLVLPAAAVTGVRVVPPRAGADGIPRRGYLHRSWFPRLVIDASDGDYLFEVSWGRARRVADRITAMMGQAA